VKILAITANFPHITNEYSGIFVKNTLQELAKLGNEIVVIAPQKLHKKKMIFFEQDGNLKVYRPTFVTYGAKDILGFNTIKLSHGSFIKCVMNTLNKIDFIPDVIYSHFLYPAGSAAVKVGKKLNKKVFCTLGESDIKAYEKYYSHKQLCSLYNSFENIFPNTPEIENILIDNYEVSKSKVEFIPNGVDITKFYPMDKKECRNKLNLPKEEKIVLFIGNFIERKGPLRVEEACKVLKKTPKMIFIGSGSQIPQDENVIFSGKVAHDMLPLYLNACDVFVLPTKNEGMPNVILEAMACNTSIVTSDIDVNKLILVKYENKILCKHDDVDCISKGIEDLLDTKLVEHFDFQFTLKQRTIKIMELLKK